jgi:hypothetical protein
MEQLYSWPWVQAQVAQTIEGWNSCALPSIPQSAHYTARQQRAHEKAYDKGLRAVQRETRRAPRNAAERLAAQQRIVASFPSFASVALGLADDESELISGQFLPMGTELARWARSFDCSLSTNDIIQACRNAWSCCGLQSLLGQPTALTPSILAYSLLYPYSDNYLDHPGLSTADKIEFSERFRQRLCGQLLSPGNAHEAAVWTMVQMIEEQYPRPLHPQVFDSLLAIHRAQEESMAQLKSARRMHNSPANSPPDSMHNSLDNSALLRISCAKGGTSVLADAVLTRPCLKPEEIQFAFDWGVLLQLGDDLQDVREDLRRGSLTLFTHAIAQGKPLDALVTQLLHFSELVAGRMDRLPNGASSLKSLLRMSWRSLVLMAVADISSFCSPAFIAGLEPCSSFRFKFLRARNESLTGRQALFDALFEAFLEAGPGDRGTLPIACNCLRPTAAQPVADLRALGSSFA